MKRMHVYIHGTRNDREVRRRALANVSTAGCPRTRLRARCREGDVPARNDDRSDQIRVTVKSRREGTLSISNASFRKTPVPTKYRSKKVQWIVKTRFSTE
jgi:hypothetical protein